MVRFENEDRVKVKVALYLTLEKLTQTKVERKRKAEDSQESLPSQRKKHLSDRNRLTLALFHLKSIKAPLSE